MPKPEWGVKRICQSCNTRFYDLMRDPILCPSCGATFDVVALAKPKRIKPEKAAKPVVEPEAETDDEIVDDDDLVEADDDSDDDDADTVVAADDDGDDDEDLADFDDDALLEDDDDDGDLDEIGDVATKDDEET